MSRLRIAVVIFCLGIIIGGLFSSSIRAQSEQWSPAVKEKILELTKEDLATDSREPFLIYSLKIIELEGELRKDIINQLNIEVSKTGNDKRWELIGVKNGEKNSPTSFNYSSRRRVNFSLANQIRQEEKKSQASYSSWLTTVGNSPVTMKLSEQFIDSKEETDSKRAYFNLGLKPKKIREGRVYTQLKLNYRRKEGSTAKAEAVGWIGESTSTPLVIIAKEATTNSQNNRKYFGLYLTAKKTTSAEELLKKQKVLAASNTKGLSKFFTSGKSISNQKLAKEVSLLINNQGGEVKFNYWNKNRLSLAVGSNKEHEFCNLGVDYSLMEAEQVFLAAEIGNKYFTSPVLRLGFSDQVSWGSNLSAIVKYFPLSYEVEPEEYFSSGRIMVKLEKGDWKSWYQGRYIKDTYLNEIGLGYNFNSSWLFKIGWQQNRDKEDLIFAGAAWKLN